eukprot:SM000043S15803  [mRNA]  locus=s43:269602:276650:+ [translate_table: standard]
MVFRRATHASYTFLDSSCRSHLFTKLVNTLNSGIGDRCIYLKLASIQPSGFHVIDLDVKGPPAAGRVKLLSKIHKLQGSPAVYLILAVGYLQGSVSEGQGGPPMTGKLLLEKVGEERFLEGGNYLEGWRSPDPPAAVGF